MLTKEDIPRLIETNYITKQTKAIFDGEFLKTLSQIPWQDWLLTPNTWRCRPQYLESIDTWIRSSKLNTVKGLERFKQRHLINGTTQTFDEAYMVYANKRLRVLPGEYAYHSRIVKNMAFIGDEPLEKGDYIILSAPFCSTGNLHHETYNILDIALEHNIPVIVDCAFYGTCTDFELDVSHPAIESVSFSLTKGLGLGDIRSGIRYSNIDDQNPIAQQNTYDHTVLCAAKIGIHMMNNFSPDHIANKFRQSQIAICKELGLTPSNCMHLALGDDTWGDFVIAPNLFRIGIRDLVKARFKKEL